MQLKAVRTVAVGDFLLEVGGQIDDVDGVEGALLGADAAADTQALGDEGDFAVGRDFDAEFACAYHGAGLLAFLTAFLGFAFVAVYDGDTGRQLEAFLYMCLFMSIPSEFVSHDCDSFCYCSLRFKFGAANNIKL